MTDAPQHSKPIVGIAEVAPADGESVCDDWPRVIGPRLVRLARRIVWNEHDAEEIAQEALALCLAKGRRPHEAARRNAWLIRATVNLCMNHRRRRRTESFSAEPADRTGTDRPMECHELAARIRAVIGELTDRQQAALVLRDMEGMTYEQVAVVLKCRLGTVRVLVHRARETVRRQLLRRWPDSFG